VSNKAFLMSYVHNKLIEEPQWGPTLANVRYETSWMDFVAQGYGANNPLPSIYDMYVYSWLHAGLCLGTILYTKVYVGQIPKDNKRIEANNRVLNNLPKPFEATFVPMKGRGHNTDGELTWTASIVLGQTLHTGEVIEEELPSGQAPLEVGATESHRTLMHLLEEKRLARWAYGDEYIKLVYVRDVRWQLLV